MMLERDHAQVACSASHAQTVCSSSHAQAACSAAAWGRKQDDVTDDVERGWMDDISHAGGHGMDSVQIMEKGFQ